MSTKASDISRSQSEEASSGNNSSTSASVNVHEESADTSVKSAVQVITRYMCKYCGLQFIHRPDMDAHATLHNDEKPPLTCGVCGKTYNTRSKLQRHVRVHSGERPFPCTVCGKRFPRSDHVKQHMKVHLRVGYTPSKYAEKSDSPQKNYCRLCGVKFESKPELQEHLLTHGFSKLFSCSLCCEVFDSSEQLKEHRTSHAHFEDSLPVLTVPTPTPSSTTSRPRKRKRGKTSSSSGKKNKDKIKFGFAKFKISRKSGSQVWQAVNPALKCEEAVPPETAASPAEDSSMPILEKILTQTEKIYTETEMAEKAADTLCETVSEGGVGEEEEAADSDVPQMSISACYSLAEGQDNSDIPDIEEIRASTLTDGSNMIVIPTSSESVDEADNNSQTADSEDGEDTEETASTGAGQGLTSSQTIAGCTNSSQPQISQVRCIKPTSVSTATTTATATLMTLQQEVHPQIASTVTAVPNTQTGTMTTVSSTRPTISLLPNVLTFRTHPVLATTAMHLHPTAAHPSTFTNNLYSSFSSQSRGSMTNLSTMEGVPPSRKMMRCHYCCIWFEDSALGLLHQSLHSADETDPFTCKKCLKRLGNRLEFTAHIVWHLDPTMEDSGAL